MASTPIGKAGGMKLRTGYLPYWRDPKTGLAFIAVVVNGRTIGTRLVGWRLRFKPANDHHGEWPGPG